MNRNETLRAVIFESESPLSGHSLSNRQLKLDLQGQARLNHARRIAGLPTQGLRIEQPIIASKVTPVII